MEYYRILHSRLFRICIIFQALVGTSVHADTLEWERYWVQVEGSNPRLQGLKKASDEARSQIALPLPAPMISFGSMGMNSPVSGVMEQTIEVAQKIPFPTKFSAYSGLKNGRVRTAELEAQIRVGEFKRDVYGAFVDLSTVVRQRALLSEKQIFFSDHLKRLRSLTISDQTQQLHILEMDAEQANVRLELAKLDADEKGLRAKLAAYLSGSADGSASSASEASTLFGEPHLPAVDMNSGGNPDKIEASPYVLLAQSGENVVSQERSVAKSTWLPDISLTYRRRLRKDGLMPSNHEAMIGVELPFVWGWQTHAVNNAAELKESNAALAAEQVRRDIAAEVAGLKIRITSVRDQLRLMNKQILPNLERRIHLLHRLAQTDMESLDLHRATYERFIDGKLKYINLESELRKSMMALDTLMGEPK